MSYITLNDIQVAGGKIEYLFTCDELLKKYFSKQPFIIEYPINVEEVPKAVLAIPFVTNVLPIIWLTNSELILPELDNDFYKSIPEFKEGYIDMYPEAAWLGTITVEKIVDCTPKKTQGAIAFFSGGLDATTTLLKHYKENPDLIVIWGADIAFDNQNGWNTMYKGLKEAADDYKLQLDVVRSTFRRFDNEGVLQEEFTPVLKDGWWHGVKHGIGIIGHAAPIAWIKKKKNIYIASSFSQADKNVRCASYPTIDEKVRFCGCGLIHDGFEYRRQDKVEYVVNYRKKYNTPISLHVCWESEAGSNCCQCEKCYRTMMGIWAAGDDPSEYGFLYREDVFQKIYACMAINYDYSQGAFRWKPIQKTFQKNWNMVQNKEYADKVKWILDFDFDNPDKNLCRIRYKRKLKNMEVKERIASKFPWLYSAKQKIFMK